MGSNLRFKSFQNYSKFYTETLKTQNTKVVHLDKIYNFDYGFTLKFLLDFELHKRGKTGFSGNQSFESNSNLIWFLH
jgi:hypothetical protein